MTYQILKTEINSQKHGCVVKFEYARNLIYPNGRLCKDCNHKMTVLNDFWVCSNPYCNLNEIEIEIADNTSQSIKNDNIITIRRII
jgi:hypothetical protein